MLVLPHVSPLILPSYRLQGNLVLDAHVRTGIAHVLRRAGVGREIASPSTGYLGPDQVQQETVRAGCGSEGPRSSRPSTGQSHELQKYPLVRALPKYPLFERY
jgi:hypothetical protein